MRIIAGQFRRRPLKAPKGFLTRPSTDRTRESIFNLVASRLDLEDVSVLDLYAGSGALGLEAISRGARSAVFVESDPRVLQFARQNAESLGVANACQFHRGESRVYLTRYAGRAFDLVLADPPYEAPEVPELPALVLPHVAPGGLFVLEHDVSTRFEDHPNLDTARAYGRTIVSIFSAEG
jgi:16S rRNA (guanine(966)-N(2))-methyltransferase RsmD